MYITSIDHLRIQPIAWELFTCLKPSATYSPLRFGSLLLLQSFVLFLGQAEPLKTVPESNKEIGETNHNSVRPQMPIVPLQLAHSERADDRWVIAGSEVPAEVIDPGTASIAAVVRNLYCGRCLSVVRQLPSCCVAVDSGYRGHGWPPN